jgi:hypothetical protein
MRKPRVRPPIDTPERDSLRNVDPNWAISIQESYRPDLIRSSAQKRAPYRPRTFQISMRQIADFIAREYLDRTTVETFASNIYVARLDAVFDGVETDFPNIIPITPDLSDGKKCTLLQLGAGPIYMMDDPPDPGFFSLYGDDLRSIRFGVAPQATDVVDIICGQVTTALPPRYIVLSGYLRALDAGITFNAWTIPDGVTGTIEVDAAGSRGSCEDQATTTDAEFPLELDGAPIGTVTFAVGSDVPTFTVASPITVTPGSVVTMTNPYPANSTLAGVSVSIRVTLV